MKPGKDPEKEAYRMRGLNSLTPEQRRENASKAGKKAGENRRRRAKMREVALMILDLDIPNEEAKAALVDAGFDEEQANIAAGILFAAAIKGLEGDIEAARFVRDTSGQKPTDSVQVGNLEDKPFETLDLRSLTTDQLKELAAGRLEALVDQMQ